jgi:hypothetical protein
VEEGEKGGLVTLTDAVFDSAKARDSHVQLASFFFVDLAGSELKPRARSAPSNDEGGKSNVAGGNMNRSLKMLGTVIRDLATGQNRTHIPYRYVLL